MFFNFWEIKIFPSLFGIFFNSEIIKEKTINFPLLIVFQNNKYLKK